MAHNSPARPGQQTTPWLGVITLGFGIFMMTTMEELPIGVLTLVAEHYQVANGTVGLGVTVPGFLAGVIAVVAPGLLGKVDRRILLSVALVMAALSGMLSAIAPTIELFLFSRLFVGLALGVFWSLLGATVARISRPADMARALTVASSGSGAALVLGIPFATWLGTRFGWQEAFAICSAIVLITAVAVLFTVPRMRQGIPTTMKDTVRAWRIRGVKFSVIFTLLLVTAQFTAYTYASPILQEQAGMSVEQVAVGLLAFGVAGICGNFLAGPLIHRNIARTMMIMTGGISIALLVLMLVVHNPVTGILGMLMWGLFAGMISVVTQAWVIQVAPKVTESANGLNSGAFNIAIGLGAFVGGQVDASLLRFTHIDALAGGTGSVIVVALCGVLVAFAMTMAVRHVRFPATVRQHPVQ
ncbi:MFS transporter [Corynebacterium choanae]|uniref:Sugar efflux transporter B n=1 Tax=Corynebacterium choanae TaxID=1862358 RepID=A0A3G6JA60_9CORY|nr:Sugar efflux transporter B [Corynebacterium choanae]